MKFVALIIRNTLRNRRRTLLTILSISMSLFLICTLRTLLDSLENPPMTPESAKRLVTRRNTSLADVMPISYRERLRRVDGVDAVVASQWFGGVYKDPANFFAQFAVDPDQFFNVYGEIHTETPEQKEAFLRNRTASLAGINLAKRFGWKVGDRITLEGTIFPGNAETTLAGLVEGGGAESAFYFRWDYLNEIFPQNIAGTFVVKVKNPDELPAVGQAIDATFLNTSAPTKTETEAAFILSFMSMWGNVRVLVMSISTVVLFTVVLVAANTMAMSIRERTGEIAILRTLGFVPGQILGMMIAESAAIAITVGLLGSLAARFLYGFANFNSISNGFIQAFTVRWTTVGMAVGIALAVALLSTFVPAYSASRIPISVAVR